MQDTLEWRAGWLLNCDQRLLKHIIVRILKKSLIFVQLLLKLRAGKKIDERDALQMSRNAIDKGAVGVDYN